MDELTFAEIELLLLIAISQSPNSVKDIAAVSGIKASTLYKWKTAKVHLSAKKADALLTYFYENEPFILTLAIITETVLLLLLTKTDN